MLVCHLSQTHYFIKVLLSTTDASSRTSQSSNSIIFLQNLVTENRKKTAYGKPAGLGLLLTMSPADLNFSSPKQEGIKSGTPTTINWFFRCSFPHTPREIIQQTKTVAFKRRFVWWPVAFFALAQCTSCLNKDYPQIYGWAQSRAWTNA